MAGWEQSDMKGIDCYGMDESSQIWKEYIEMAWMRAFRYERNRLLWHGWEQSDTCLTFTLWNRSAQKKICQDTCTSLVKLRSK